MFGPSKFLENTMRGTEIYHKSSIQNPKKEEPLMFYQSSVAAPEEYKLSCQFNNFISLKFKFYVKSKLDIAPNLNFLFSRNHTEGLIKG